MQAFNTFSALVYAAHELGRSWHARIFRCTSLIQFNLLAVVEPQLLSRPAVVQAVSFATFQAVLQANQCPPRNLHKLSLSLLKDPRQ